MISFNEMSVLKHKINKTRKWSHLKFSLHFLNVHYSINSKNNGQNISKIIKLIYPSNIEVG